MKNLIIVVSLMVVMCSFSIVEGAWTFQSSPSIDGDNKAIDTISVSKVYRNEGPMLMIRNHSRTGWDVVMGCTTLRFAGDQTCRARFDNGPVEIFNVAYAADFRDMLIHEDQKEDFIAKLRKSNRVIIEWNLNGNLRGGKKMENGATFLLTIFLIISIFIVLFIIFVFNSLVSLKNNIRKSWANIDVLLKQRYDEIPKLIKVCEGYMKYERETLEKITLARTQFLNAKNPAEIAKADSTLAGGLKTLFAVSENYPELKANANFKQLQERVSYLENQIADRREFFNDSIAIFNTRIKQLPDIFIANMLGYQQQEMYKVAEAEKVSPDIKFDMPK